MGERNNLEQLEWYLDQLLLCGELGDPETATKMCDVFDKFLKRLMYFPAYDDRLRVSIDKAAAELKDPHRSEPHLISKALDTFNVNLTRARDGDA